MAWYSLGDILHQELPDIILIDLAFHLHANDNWPFSIRLSRGRHSEPSSEMAAEHSVPNRPL
jgi:hypothetical protein